MTQTMGEKHRAAAEKFLTALGTPVESKKGYIRWAAKGREVLALLREFHFSDHPDLAAISDTSLFEDYIQDRIADELADWDVAVPMRQTGNTKPFAGAEA